MTTMTTTTALYRVLLLSLAAPLLGVSAADEFEVRVVDAAGAPRSGVLVGAVLRAADGGEEDPRWIVASGEDGVARLSIPGPELVQAEQEGRRPLAVLALPHWPEQSASLGGEEEVELALPPVGSVVLELVDADGAPLADGTQVDLKPFARDEVTGNWWPAARAMRRTKDGRVVFEHVQLGLPLRAHAHTRGGPLQIQEVVRGPESEGSERVLRLVSPGWSPRLTATLEDAGGETLARRNIEVHVFWWHDDRGERHDDVRARTDRDGKLDVVLAPLHDGARIEAVHLRTPAHEEGPVLWARPAVAVGWAARHMPLAIVRLETAPVLVEGRVVRYAAGAIRRRAGAGRATRGATT
jgi:hypothetical protein